MMRYTMMAVLKARRAFLFTSERRKQACLLPISSMNTLISYLKHVREEFTHIVWPTRHKAISHTFVVIFIAATIALLVGLLDYFFGLGVNRVIIGG
jgi:preprotein translocase SecE subunit